MLETLARHKVDFIVVGGLSAVLQGADVTTRDVDVVHSRTPENIARTLEALKELEAWYRLRTDIKISPKESHLRSNGHQLLSTKFGNLDVLGTIHDGMAYDDLKPLSVAVPLDQVVVDALNLEKLLEVKEKCGREKDKNALPMIRAAIQERNRQKETVQKNISDQNAEH